MSDTRFTVRSLGGALAAAALLAATGLSGGGGCATGSTAINDPGKVDTLRVGVTTIVEVRAMFGEPDDQQRNAGGDVVFVYNSISRNALGTTIAQVGSAAGSVLGTIGGARLGPGFDYTGSSVSTAVGNVVGTNIGKSADEKIHDQFKDEYRSLTVYFTAGVVRDFTISLSRK